MKRILFIILVLGLSASAVQAEESRTTEKDMILIPAGPFVMGNKLSLIELDPADLFNTDRHALGPENPAHETILDAFYIDIHEVKNADYLQYVKATGGTEPEFANDPNFNAPNQPVVGVSWKDARNHCRWKGKRLPTEAEWEKAGRGKRAVRYPWGDQPTDNKRLNFDNQVKKTTPVGSYETGKSDYGIYDLSGNVSEWVSDWHLAEYYIFSPKENPQGPEKGHYKVIRGGNWRNNAEDVDLTYRNATVPSLKSQSVGFRCAKSAP
jgi:iron(II)-dependent oxidoreductase